MRNTKKLFALILALLTVFSFAACANENDKASDSSTDDKASAEVSTNGNIGETSTTVQYVGAKEIVYGDVEEKCLTRFTTGMQSPAGYTEYEFEVDENKLYYVYFEFLPTYDEVAFDETDAEECERCEKNYQERLKLIEEYCLKTYSGEALEYLQTKGIDDEWIEKYGVDAWKRGGAWPFPRVDSTQLDTVIDEYLTSIGRTDLVGRSFDVAAFNQSYGFVPKDKTVDDYETEQAFIDAEFGGDTAAYNEYKAAYQKYSDALSNAVYSRNAERSRVYNDAKLEFTVSWLCSVGIDAKVEKFTNVSCATGLISAKDIDAFKTLSAACRFIPIPESFGEAEYNLMAGLK